MMKHKLACNLNTHHSRTLGFVVFLFRLTPHGFGEFGGEGGLDSVSCANPDSFHTTRGASGLDISRQSFSCYVPRLPSTRGVTAVDAPAECTTAPGCRPL